MQPHLDYSNVEAKDEGVKLELFGEPYEPGWDVHRVIAQGLACVSVSERVRNLMRTKVETHFASVQNQVRDYKLTCNQAMAIIYFTADARDCEGVIEHSPYFVLNIALATGDKLIIDQWRPFLRYLVVGLGKLPPTLSEEYVYRAVTGVSQQFEKGKQLVWPGFATCSTEPSPMNSFIGNGALLKIRTSDGRKLGALSFFPKECDVVLPANTYLKVVKAQKDKVIELHQLTTPPNFDVFTSNLKCGHQYMLWTTKLTGEELKETTFETRDQVMKAFEKSDYPARCIVAHNGEELVLNCISSGFKVPYADAKYLRLMVPFFNHLFNTGTKRSREDQSTPNKKQKLESGAPRATTQGDDGQQQTTNDDE